MVLILGTTKRKLDCGHTTHRLAPEMVTAGLLDQLQGEYGVSWYVCVMFAEGHASFRGLTDTSPGPNSQVREKMFRCSAKLNRDLHNDGCWIVVWHDDRMSFMWRDQDGDSAFITQIDEPWVRISRWSVEEFCSRAETSFRQFWEMMRWVDRKPEDTIKRALGETPRITIH